MYLNILNTNSLFLTPTRKEDIASIISTFKLHKATGPNSIPIRTLKNLKVELLEPLAKLTNLSFSTGQFPNHSNLLK